VFYNRTRRHSFLDQLSPMAFEQLQTGSWKTSTKVGEVQSYNHIISILFSPSDSGEMFNFLKSKLNHSNPIIVVLNK
jgi:hypothetical protein